MDIAFFGVGLTLGISIGLVNRRNGSRLFTSYSEWDMGPVGKQTFYRKMY